jgi:hypothetical protein
MFSFGEAKVANVVLPKVRMFIPCLGVGQEPGSGVTIHTPLHTVRLPAGVIGNVLLTDLWFYVVLTDGVGKFRLSVEVRGTDDIILGKSELHQVTFVGGDQLSVKEISLYLMSLPLARPGLYEFRLVANHVHLEDGGTALLRVLPG